MTSTSSTSVNLTPEQVLSNIKAEMARRGINQRELADLLGIAPGSLSEVMSGKSNLSTARLLRIGDLLGLHAAVFLKESA